MNTPPIPEHLRAGQRLHRDYPADITLTTATATDAAGTIEGYASVFDVTDSYGEQIRPGAFTRTIGAWKAKGKPVPVLWQHNTYQPIGATTEIGEDERGLRVKARLLVEDVSQAREAHALAAANILGGLSIGFSIPRATSAGAPAITYDDATDTWQIHEVRLWEYSLVTFPANDEATIDVVRAATTAAQAAQSAALAATEAFATAATGITERLRELRAILAAPAPAPAADPRLSAQTAMLREAARLLTRE